jgi:hypothetical protein
VIASTNAAKDSGEIHPLYKITVVRLLDEHRYDSFPTIKIRRENSTVLYITSIDTVILLYCS